jgi:hypothetical protein
MNAKTLLGARLSLASVLLTSWLVGCGSDAGDGGTTAEQNVRADDDTVQGPDDPQQPDVDADADVSPDAAPTSDAGSKSDSDAGTCVVDRRVILVKAQTYCDGVHAKDTWANNCGTIVATTSSYSEAEDAKCCPTAGETYEHAMCDFSQYFDLWTNGCGVSHYRREPSGDATCARCDDPNGEHAFCFWNGVPRKY